MNTCRSYVFLSRKPPTQESPGNPIAIVENALIANEICKLFHKQYAVSAGQVFHHLPLNAFSLTDQVLFDEILQSLDVYSDPDPFLYDSPPGGELLRDAQYAKQATEWETILQDKLSKLSDAERNALASLSNDSRGTEVTDPHHHFGQMDAGSIAYVAYTSPQTLKRFGAPVVMNWIEPYLSELRHNGIVVPSVKSPDFFFKISAILRDLQRLPAGLKRTIIELIEASRLLGLKYRSIIESDFQAVHDLAQLQRVETGKRLLQLVASVHGMIEEHPDTLSTEQSEHLGSLLDELRDYANCHDDIESSDELRFERRITDTISALEQRGLAIFAGTLEINITHGKEPSNRSPVVVLMAVTLDDPRIQQSEEGSRIIKIALPRNNQKGVGAKPDNSNSKANQDPKGDNAPHSQTTPNSTVEFKTKGRLRYSSDFQDVWLDQTHFNLRNRRKAQLCLQFLIERQAFASASACHLVNEIDMYVRQQGNYPRSADIKVDHYFKDSKGPLTELRQRLIHSVKGTGRYYLKVE